MARKGYTEEQIGFALRQAESGTAVTEICRKMGVAQGTSTASMRMAFKCKPTWPAQL